MIAQTRQTVKAIGRRMRLYESRTAQIAVRIGNILKAAGKPEYWDMAYFDQSVGVFKWKL